MFAFDLESPANFSRVIGFRSVDRGFLHAFDVSRSNHPVRSRRSRQRLGLYGPSRLGSSASINSTSSGDKISFGS